MPVVSSSKDSSVEGLEELHDLMVEEPSPHPLLAPPRGGGALSNVSIYFAWLSMTALVRAVLESGLLGQMSFASSGHYRSAALWVKKTVGRPRVSTMERRRLR